MRFVQRVMEDAPEALLEMGLHPRIAQLLATRGIETAEQAKAFLSPSIQSLHDPFLMRDMQAAVDCLSAAIEKGERIVVYGDYDVDGVTSTAILLTYLRKRGAVADYYIPSRHGEGYGLNIPAVECIAKEKQAQLLITVDCGITSATEVARAYELGMRVIVTDHHQIGEELPRCEAVLNPLLGGYPFDRLCGAGVAIKLVQAMGGIEAVEPLLDLAALATVADLVPLIGENRVLVAEGLVALRRAQRPGIRALIEVAGIQAETLSAGQIGFQLAPRINAGGRLANASRNVELLTTRDAKLAQAIAEELDAQNKERQLVEQRILQEAEALLPKEVDFLRDRIIVLCGEGWNPGVIGLVASRLAERYRWPVLLMAREGEVCVGSARSIPGINMHAALFACRDLFLRFGGHAQAAGLTMGTAQLPQLRERLNAVIEAQAQPETFLPTEFYDFEMTLADVQEGLVTQLEQLQPTGFGNPMPQLCLRGVAPVEAKAVGREGAHLKLILAQEGELREGIAFGKGAMAPDMPERIDVLCAASLNVWQDRRTVQCEIRHIVPNAAPKAFLARCARDENAFFRAICRQILYNSAIPGLQSACPAESGRVRMLPTDALDAAVRGALEQRVQGTLLVAHTLSALRKWTVRLAVMQAQLQYTVGLPKDRRGFNTLCVAPCFAQAGEQPQPTHIALLDGVADTQELAAWAHVFPKAIIFCSADAAQRKLALAPHIPTDDLLRTLYKALRRSPQSLSALAAQAQCSEAAACVALHVLEELALIECSFFPWQVSLLPAHKKELADSKILQGLRTLIA